MYIRGRAAPAPQHAHDERNSSDIAPGDAGPSDPAPSVVAPPRRGQRLPLSGKETLRQFLRPLVRLLSALRVQPDALTTAGWALSIGAATLFALGFVRTAGAVVLFAGLFDALDGAVARESGKISRFGAFLDSTLDRLSEAAIFAGIVFFYANSGQPFGSLLAAAAMVFSLSTSYARARAEGLGIPCEVGLLERAGRVALLSASALTGFLTAGMALIAAGALVTTTQRILHVRRQTRDAGS